MHCLTRHAMTALLVAGLMLAFATPAHALDLEHWEKADAAVERGIEFLRATQNDDGSWTPDPGPAVTALAVSVMLDRPDIDRTDPTVAKALDYILSKRRDDGAIHDGILANYNTSISVSALSKVRDHPEAAAAVRDAIAFLRTLQWSDQLDPEGNPITPDHPWYGGAGYGGSGRPDMSNTQFMLQAVHDAGLDCNDPIFQRAMVFISRCQGVASNEMYGDKINNDGGLIYSTTINRDHIGVPESKASPDQIDEGKAGRPVSGLRTYGSITYAGFKSFLYANLSRDDPRVEAAWDWVRHHYTLDRNPGMPPEVDQQGLYYYYMTFGRALAAFGSTYVPVVSAQPVELDRLPAETKMSAVIERLDSLKNAGHTDVSMATAEDGSVRFLSQGNTPPQADWANDLITAVIERQQDNGSWSNDADRWMEGDPNLATCYALIALTNAMD